MKTTWLTGTALMLLLPLSAVAATTANDLATPLGITLQPMGPAQGYGVEAHLMGAAPREEIAYADSRGKTLYTYDKDQPGKSMCVDACAQRWVPVTADKKAKAAGAWTLISRADGSKQWALGGKPVYTFSLDVDPASTFGKSPKAKEPRRGVAARGPKVDTVEVSAEERKDWHTALIFPSTATVVPAGIDIREVADGPGMVLVNARSYTLYTFDGDLKRDKPNCGATACSSAWQPFSAPTLGVPVGDFAFVQRGDGVQQWTYKGKALYTYDGDLVPGDANGAGVDKRWQVAQVARYFVPENVKIEKNRLLGTAFATVSGQTLYRRDGFAWQSGGGHSARHGVPIRPAVGRDLGTKAGCDAECLKVWHPLAAPADAQPSGYWDVATRADGSKQWAYQGYTLWTYDGDKKPGDMNGHDIFDVSLSDDPTKDNDVGTPMMGIPALYWFVATP